MKQLVILRGLPGSGKSTVAQKIVEHAQNAVICSADHYFMKDGKYDFNAAELPQAHADCQMSANRAMANGRNPVVIDNTNIKCSHMQPYIEMAERYDYVVVVWPVGGQRANDVEEYMARQIHGVPRALMEKMANEYESVYKSCY